MTFADPFPADAYLLRKERRFRIRTAKGAIDLSAVRTVAKILPFARELPEVERARLGRVLDRIDKAAIAYGDAAAAGFLDDRFGFPILVEVPMGGKRTGIGPDGQPWEQTLDGCGYGFLPDTIARDAEPIDVIVGPEGAAPMVFILAQLPRDPAPGMAAAIDEYKLGVGFRTLEDFLSTYARNWPPECAGDVCAMPVEVLRGLLGFELDEGVVAKSLSTITRGGLVAVGTAGAVIGRVELVRKAEWSTAYVNGLGDDAFLYIAPGGEKDADGKTTPRELRHFPVKDKDGKVDRAHLVNALARIPQADIPDEAKSHARAKAQRMLDDLNGKEEKDGGVLAALASAFDRHYSEAQRRRNNGASGTPAVDPPPAPPADGATTKGPTTVATFAAGGVRLPGQGAPRMRRGKVLAALDELADAAACKAARCAKALDSSRAYQGATTHLDERPELEDHPSKTAPLSWTYDDPADVGGWLGAIEPEDESWICFVDVNGRALLWTAREPDGAVVGTPVEFKRPDLARPELVQSEKSKPRTPEVVMTIHTNGVGAESLKRLIEELHAQGRTGHSFGIVTDDSPPVSLGGWDGDGGAWAEVAGVEKVDKSAQPGAPTMKGTAKLLPLAKDLTAATPVDRRVVYGVVLEPEPFEGRGDAHDETYSAAVIELAAHNWLASFRNFDDSHGRFFRSDEIVVVESFIAPVDFTIGGTVIKAGSWVLAARIVSDLLWARVLRGEFSAWSIEGYAARVPNVAGSA